MVTEPTTRRQQNVRVFIAILQHPVLLLPILLLPCTGCLPQPPGLLSARPASEWQLLSNDAAAVGFEDPADQPDGVDLTPLEVRQRNGADGFIQQIVLANPTITPGENYVRFGMRRREGLFGALLQPEDRLEDFPLDLDQRGLMEVLGHEFPTGVARVSTEIRTNRYGPFSYAHLEQPLEPLACLYAWQQFESLPFQTFPAPTDLEGNLVVRYCADTDSVAPLLAVMETLSLDLGAGGGPLAPPDARGATSPFGDTRLFR